MKLIRQHARPSAGLLDSVTRRWGAPLIAEVPRTSLNDDQTDQFAQLHARFEQVDVVLFREICPGNLDGFFRLRLVQVLDERPPLPALSVVVLSAGLTGPPLAGGFADRFRRGWPFARCVFLTEGDDHEALSEQLDVPVRPFDDPVVTPEILFSEADAGQRIALHMQPPSSRCGSTILFENQVEDLVRAGFLTIRVFTDGQWRRGATLRSLLGDIVRDNGVHAGAHINVVAVPDGPPTRLMADDPERTWRNRLTAMTACRIHDDAVMRAAGWAECVIANHLECLGPAVTLAPQARLLLALHEDRAVSARHLAMREGEAAAMKSAIAAAQVQARILGIADICTFNSVTELADLAPRCERAVPVLPRVYIVPPPDGVAPRFDLLLVGGEHELNIVSLRWFLEEVWRPYLEPHSVSVAIVGQAGERIDSASLASPLLHVLGFVEELEAIRSWCRLTVVPDTGGGGISIKMLTTLAAGHAVVTTRAGLRGLAPSIAGVLPAHDAPDALAADILDLIGSPARLAERRRLVRQVREAASHVTDHADLVMAAARPSAAGGRERLARWSGLVDAPQPPDAAPYYFVIDAAFPMSGSPSDARVLMDGWHEPESWGRWTDGAVASLRITLEAPISEPLTLELDIVPSAVGASLRVDWDGSMLGLIDPTSGTNGWDISPELSVGKSSVLVSLQAGDVVCPARVGDSPDHRILGIGVSAVRLRSRQPSVCHLNTFMPITSRTMLRGVLIGGWHMLEDWGCWSSKTTASLRLSMSAPPRGPIRLELTLTLAQAHTVLTLVVNEVALPAITPVSGLNHWDLPPAATDGRTELHVLLTVPEMFCPVGAGTSADDRELGIGLRGIRVVSVVPEFVSLGTALRLAMAAALDQVLLDGWHPAEEWGCWSSQKDAVLRLRFRDPLVGQLRLEIDLAPPPVVTGLTLSVNGQALAEVVPVSGGNVWSLPESLTDGQQALLIGLHVADMVCPAELGTSSDSRVLGVGVRWVALHQAGGAICPIGTVVRISSDPGGSGMLLDGWHPPEPWGCWSSGSEASMLLRFDAPLRGAYRLEVEMVPPLLDLSVTLSIDDTVLDTLFVSNEPSEWVLPRCCTDGRNEMIVHLLVPRPARPKDVMDSRDDRILGVGIRSFRLLALGEA